MHGIAVFTGHPLAETTDSLDVHLNTDGDTRDLRTQARGMRGDGLWTEWRTVPERTGHEDGGAVRKGSDRAPVVASWDQTPV